MGKQSEENQSNNRAGGRAMKKYYIRFGKIPENEISSIYRGEVKVGEEKGVSVYDAIKIDEEYRIVLPFPLVKEIGFDLYNFIENLHHPIKTEQRSMYLVQGDEIGRGSTNEPLLKNITIIKKL